MSNSSETTTFRSIALSRFNQGICLALSAGFLFTTQDMTVQLVLLRGMDVPSIGIFQGILGAVFAYQCLIRNKEEHIFDGSPGKRLLLWTRGAAITGSSIFFFSSVKYLPLSIAVLVFQLRPLMMSYISYLFGLGESLNIQQLLASLCMLVGVGLVAQPGSNEGDIGATPWERILGAFFVIMCILCSSYGILITRKLASSVSNEMMLGIFCLADLVICSGWLLVELQPLKFPQTWSSAVYVFLIAATQIAGRLASSSSLRRISALTVALIAQTQVLFSIMEEWITLGSHINLMGCGGAVIILASGTWALLASPADEVERGESAKGQEEAIEVGNDGHEGSASPLLGSAHHSFEQV